MSATAALLAYLVGRRHARGRPDETVVAEATVEGDEAQPGTGDRDRGGERGGPVAALVLAAAAVLVVTTWVLVRDIGPPEQPSTSGGLLLLTNRAPGDPADVASLRVDIEDTGFPGVSALRATIRFERPRRGLRWTLVASGQYEIPLDVPTAGFCRFRAERTSPTEVVCPVDVESGPPVVVSGDRELAVGGPDGVYGVIDYDGYEAAGSSMVRGGIPSLPAGDPAAGTAETRLPIRTPATTSAGSNTYGVLAPVGAVNLADYGSGPKLGDRRLELPTGLLDATTLEPLSEASISDVRLALPAELGFEELATARPRPVSDTRLEWTSPDIRSGPIRFVLHDPVREGRVVRRTFLGGVTGGLAAGFFVLGLELLLVRRRAGDRL